MDITLIRQVNLQKLIDDFPHNPGNRAAFCRHYGLDALQIGQYFTESKNGRNIGERKAQSIEKLVGLTTGWLSQEQPDNPYAKTQSAPALHVADERRDDSYANAGQMQLMWATAEEAAILTQYRLATSESQKMMSNFADKLIKDPEKLKKLIKLAI